MKKGNKATGKGTPSAPKEDAPRSLLDPRSWGWKIVAEWDGLFTLYERKGEAKVTKKSELQHIINALERGHSVGDVPCSKLERAMLMALTVHLVRLEGSSRRDDKAEQIIVEDFAATLGAAVLRIFEAKGRASSELRASEALSLCKRAIDGLVRMKFPPKARGSGEWRAKPVRAIEAAQYLCGLHRRLPTKEEVVMFLDPGKTAFGRTKDWRGKWREVLDNAGLSTLPGAVPPRN